MVTQIKKSGTSINRNANTTKVSRKVSTSRAAAGSELDAKPPRSPRKSTKAQAGVQDTNFKDFDAASSDVKPKATAKDPIQQLLAHGKNLMSGDASSVATAAVILVGAALIEVELIPGLVIGAGAMLLSKVFPEMGDYVRPAVKGAVRAGFVMTSKAREVMAETSEQVQDLVAEVMLEQKHAKTGKKASAVAEPVSGSVPLV